MNEMNEITDRFGEVVDLMRHNWPQAKADQAGAVIATMRLARLLQKVASDQLAPFDLSYTEFEVLSALRVNPTPHKLAPSDLYARMLISSGGLTKLLKSLENKGFVTRPASGGDRRIRPIQLTDLGKDTVNAAMVAVQAAEAPMLAGLDDPLTDGQSVGDVLPELVSRAEAMKPE